MNRREFIHYSIDIIEKKLSFGLPLEASELAMIEKTEKLLLDWIAHVKFNIEEQKKRIDQ